MKGWRAVRFYGEVHLVPMVDQRAHTWPMCWCRPIPENVVTEDVTSFVFSHNALDGRA